MQFTLSDEPTMGGGNYIIISGTVIALTYEATGRLRGSEGAFSVDGYVTTTFGVSKYRPRISGGGIVEEIGIY